MRKATVMKLRRALLAHDGLGNASSPKMADFRAETFRHRFRRVKRAYSRGLLGRAGA